MRFSGTVEYDSNFDGEGTERFIYKFPNWYGASVIRSKYSYGKWELAVLRWSNGTWYIDYGTPVTSDIVSGLNSIESVAVLLAKISKLPRAR